MKTELIDVSSTRKEIKIEIEPEQIRSAFDRISQQYSKAATIPGFRPGHAPTSVVRTRYKSEIRTEVLRELLPEAVTNALVEHSLNPIGEPDVQLDNTEALERLGDEPLTLKVAVEVLPEVTLNEYKGLEATRRTRPITDADVDEVIENWRDSTASMEPVEDRASELGDTVTINARGRFIDDAPDAEEIKVDDVEVVLGGPGVQKEFTDTLTGVRPDETKTFLVDYPADFTSPGLAGKKVEYTADVTAVRKKVLPDLDDEWAKSLGEFDTVDAVRARVREDLEARATSESEHNLRADVVRKLLEGHPFDVPDTLVEQQINARLQDVARQMMSRGIDPRNEKLDWERARDEVKEQAEEDVRATMLLAKIAHAENLTASNEEIDAEINAIATASRQSIEQVRAALTKNEGERSIAQRLRNRKALDLLIENARVTDGEWSEPTPADDAPKDE